MLKINKSTLSRHIRYRAELIVIGLTFALNALVQAYSHYAYNYTTDDTSPQVVFNNWKHMGFSNSYMPSDTFLVKFPVHHIMESIFGQTRFTLFITSFILTCFMLGALFFLYKKALSYRTGNIIPYLILFPWVASLFSAGFTLSMRNTNVRCFEIGLWISLFLLFSNLTQKYKLGRPRLIALGLLGGLILYSDPALLIIGVLPFMIAAALSYFRYKPLQAELQSYGIFIVACLLSYKALDLVLSALGIHAFHPQFTFIALEQLPNALSTAVSYLIDFCGANFFGKAVFKISTISATLNFLVLIVGIYATTKAFFSKDRVRETVGVLTILIFLSYLLSGAVGDVYSSRYLLLIPFLLVLSTALMLVAQKNKRTLEFISVIIILASTLNGFTYIIKIRAARINARTSDYLLNQNDYKLIDILNENSLHNGYSPLAYAHTVSYFSANTINITPIECNGSTPRPIYWLTTKKLIEQKPKRFFVISLEPESQYVSTYDYPAAGLKAGVHYGCSQLKITSKFGLPKKIIPLDNNTSVMIYELPPAVPFEDMPPKGNSSIEI